MNLMRLCGFQASFGSSSRYTDSLALLSLYSAELNKLVRKDSRYRAGPLPAPAARSFQALKHALISKPCLQPVNFAKRIIITTDASATHYGSCMSQIGSDNIERPCGYHSKFYHSKNLSSSRACVNKRRSFTPSDTGDRI